MNSYHITNGDNLKQLLQDEYSNILVMREALCQGPIQDDNFFENRSQFISQEYKACTQEQYLESIEEFEKIKNIPDNMDINLWFGTDVFCQVNFWFLIAFLNNKHDSNSFYLVLPCSEQNCSFGNKEYAKTAFTNKIQLTSDEIEQFSMLWKAFQKDDYETIENIVKNLQNRFSFLPEAVEAMVNLPKCLEELSAFNKMHDNFIDTFKEFSETYSIYGYGDLQVKYLLNQQ